MVASKYTRSKVRKALPADFAYIIDELLNTDPGVKNKENYYNSIITTIIEIDRADAFITAICRRDQAAGSGPSAHRGRCV